MVDSLFEKTKIKEVYRDGNTLVKRFIPGYSKESVFNEAYIQTVVEETGIPVPSVHSVSQVDGGWAIKMDYIEGKNLQQLMDENPDRKNEYMEKFIDIQIEISKVKAPRLRNTRAKMEDEINSLHEIDPSTRYELLQRIHGMRPHRKLCHGQMVPSNIILREDGSYVVLDWAHATQGNAGADAANTYLLLSLENAEEAEEYLKLYSKKADMPIQYIQLWMPVVAAAELSKNKLEEKELLESWINVAEYM